MSDVLIYDDCTVELQVSGDWFPVLCQTEMNFKLTQEIILKTGPNSGIFREKASRLSEGFCSVRGITPIDNGTVVSFFYLAQESIRTQPQTLRIRFVDQNGGSKQISGTAIISNCEIQSQQVDFAIASIDFEFSGAVSMGTVLAPPGSETILSDYWNTVSGRIFINGASVINGYSLVGKTILEVDREGVQYDFIGNNLTPGNRQCSWDTTFDHLVFRDAFNPGETVFVIFK